MIFFALPAPRLSASQVYERLTDHSGFKGIHKHRFDSKSGKGKGRKGRDYVGRDGAAHPLAAMCARH